MLIRVGYFIVCVPMQQDLDVVSLADAASAALFAAASAAGLVFTAAFLMVTTVAAAEAAAEEAAEAEAPELATSRPCYIDKALNDSLCSTLRPPKFLRLSEYCTTRETDNATTNAIHL